MLKSGMPEIFVDATLQLATSIRSGQMSAVLPTFEQMGARVTDERRATRQ